MNKTDYREEQRAGQTLQRSILRPRAIAPGKTVVLGKASYRRSSDGASIVRLGKPDRSKKQRRRDRAAMKAAAKLPIEQQQAELAGEGA